MAILITCEHGGNRVPRTLVPSFKGWGEVLNSHRGWDPGALHLARSLALRLHAPLIASTVSRLVVELNRSAHHRLLLSDVMKQLPRQEQQRALEQWYYPYRDKVVDRIEKLQSAASGALLHVGVHSFTPTWNGKQRKAAIGLLYDPRSEQERTFCLQWQLQLQQLLPGCSVRRNDPYRGRDDGLTTAMRRKFGCQRYMGIELEVNQGLLGAHGQFPRAITTAIGKSLQRMVAPTPDTVKS